MPSPVRSFFAFIYFVACFVSWYLVINGDAHGERGIWPVSGMLFNTILAFPWSLVYVFATLKGAHMGFQLFIFMLMVGQLGSFLMLFGVDNVKYISRKLLNPTSRKG
ncbi:MAG: hypothetical protein A3B66_02600 [Alphaproteobacteria bacterium RIFCSPHIGHO2_02_FULL_46_13]|nr:MAG: hypothetical protein A3B66_02600 [Alphaproteobacteria bacterium RIFCSPHIGHO2_02_FULL_46_13]